MLIILTFCLVIASMLILFVRKSKESLFLFGLCISLMLEICGVMIFIAKKGGISPEVLEFFFFSRRLQTQIQYILITFNQLGYLIALGRTLFPLFLIELAMCYSMIPFVRKRIWIARAAAILPVVTLILYYPALYRFLTTKYVALQRLISVGSNLWITIYLIIAVFLLLFEFMSITMRFCRRQFSQIMISMFALTGIFCLYFQQDPGQVYHFYSYTFTWNRGIGYLGMNPTVFHYASLVITSIICCILGFFSLFRYTQGSFEANREDTVMERKFDTAKVGASMFVHSMKNHLLSSKVIYKRLNQLFEQENVDIAKLKEYVGALEECNTSMLTRMEELYRCVKSNSIYMVPVSMEEIVQISLERFREKYPEASVETALETNIMFLADRVHFCEAIYNLLINAQEAVLASERADAGSVKLLCHNERLYTIIEIRDNGQGMTKNQIKKIFDPFYSSKNSNFNWGMGLYYVREIVKSHLGSLRVESKEGIGSSFYILLPKYQ